MGSMSHTQATTYNYSKTLYICSNKSTFYDFMNGILYYGSMSHTQATAYNYNKTLYIFSNRCTFYILMNGILYYGVSRPRLIIVIGLLKKYPGLSSARAQGNFPSALTFSCYLNKVNVMTHSLK